MQEKDDYIFEAPRSQTDEDNAAISKLRVDPSRDDSPDGDTLHPLLPDQETSQRPAAIDGRAYVDMPEAAMAPEQVCDDKIASADSGYISQLDLDDLGSSLRRRRRKPLPPIIVEDPTDTVAMKRARNTLAQRARRARMAEIKQSETSASQETQQDRAENPHLNSPGGHLG